MIEAIGKKLGKALARAVVVAGWPIVIVAVIAVAIGAALLLNKTLSGVTSKIIAIEDPTERGLAWLAVAIFIHGWLTQPLRPKSKED